MGCNTEGINDRRLNQFEKIKDLESMVNKINDKLGNPILANLLNQIGNVPEGSFEEVVDLNNIHMWLEGFMTMVEIKYAYLVTMLMKDGIPIEEVGKVVYQIGIEKGKKVDNALEAYQLVDSKILDGMPCDKTIEILEQNEKHVVWKQVLDVHSPIWQHIKGNPENYYYLLDQYILGLLSHTSLQYTSKNQKWEIQA